jgi:hypothetical protein
MCRPSSGTRPGGSGSGWPPSTARAWGGNPFGWLVHTALPFIYHKVIQYSEVANNAINDAGNAVSDAANHIYVQFSACLLICASFTIQGGDMILSASGFSVTKWFSADGGMVRLNKGSLFAGASLGVNFATPEESIRNNTVGGACVVDGIGVCAGASGNVNGSRGLGPIRPYAAVAVGDGFQAQGGRSYSFDLSAAVDNFFASLGSYW